jgi:hypothetical protein
MMDETVKSLSMDDAVIEEIFRPNDGSEVRDSSTPASIGSTISSWLGRLRPRPEIVFMSQMLAIFVVIAFSLFNLTRGTVDDKEGKLWVVLLSSCLGYILPNPTIARTKILQ